MRSAGICLGASNIGVVKLGKEGGTVRVREWAIRPHEGNPKDVLAGVVAGLGDVDSVAVTGRKFRNKVNLPSIPEPEAVERAYGFLQERYGQVRAIVSAGGETFMVYELNEVGQITNVYTGNKCASGTGEFFLQQIKRMNLSIGEAMESADLEAPYRVAGRCSVFCKSDCTHALNKGESKGRVVAGLCQMISAKVLELLPRVGEGRILLIGGTSQNTAVVEFLRREIPDVVVPDEACYFEALGTALWALEHPGRRPGDLGGLFRTGASSFSFLPPLKDFEGRVTFKETARGVARRGDRCIIGLDVGSTTTKAVILREEDDAILASVYLRTNGDPVGASRQCYRGLSEQIKEEIRIVGLGVTGSGRQIAGLHALTDGVINEIIAHAAAAVHFDREVDTIFEIGGQDAKYTYITNQVASDYAMNEACSAGTGSFLEESARESLNIETRDIGDIALRGTNPPNFSDQCAAFISSDIKTAIQEGIATEDIVAGLVYSICQNYANRVKGNRPVGRRVFMQGGVCYNRAVPIAMAALTGNEIVVPPEPGLMGAFGVALVVKQKLQLGLLQEKECDLDELAGREVIYDKPFICAGGAERCDRKCPVSMIRINGKKYPFGGACNKYVNLVRNVSYNSADLDLVALREELAFEKYGPVVRGTGLSPDGPASGSVAKEARSKSAGLIRSLMVNALYPLFANFFDELGFKVVLAGEVDQEGIERKGAAFCYPVELSHGMLATLLKSDVDYVFLPHVKGLFVENGEKPGLTCPFVQGEPYYLRTAFKELRHREVLSPVLNFVDGYEAAGPEFVKLGLKLGASRSEARAAFDRALKAQRAFHDECRAIGRRVLDDLEQNPGEQAVVIFGRAYNAFASRANMGIPHKFASRGYRVIPYDFLSFSQEEHGRNMYWGTGQMIMKAAAFVEKHPQLFGVYITNFSCGPDSFQVGYFRKVMGQKPSLTLELDGHTADAGIDTRVEAFLDVVKSYLELDKMTREAAAARSFRPARTVMGKDGTYVVASNGGTYPLAHEKVKVLIPSMGHFAAELMAATLRSLGINAVALDEPDEEELQIGRGHSSCKECLPLILTVGSLLKYIRLERKPGDLLVYFMPDSTGPCRFGQYNVLIENLINREQLVDVAQLSLSSATSYAGLGTAFSLRGWQAVVVTDVMEDLRSALMVLAADPEGALKVHDVACRTLTGAFEKKGWESIRAALEEAASKLSRIPLRGALENADKVALVGEIYVRRDPFSRQHLVEKLADKGIVTKVAPIQEWLYYCDYVLMHDLDRRSSWGEKAGTVIDGFFKRKYEREIKRILSRSGLYEYQEINVNKIIHDVTGLISPELTSEAILTVGAALHEIIDSVSGVIAIGPFGCMPNRIAEAITSESLSEEKGRLHGDDEVVRRVLEKHRHLPFLAIETDGNVFPQIVEARLETFCLQVKRVSESIRKSG